MIRSIRFTLTLWYLAVLTVILCVFSWMLYTSVAHTFSRDVDDVLALQADSTADAVFAFWKAGEKNDEENFRPFEKIEPHELYNLIAHWADETGELETYVRILDPEGSAIIQSESMEAWGLPLTKSALLETRYRRTVYENFLVSSRRVRMITWPMIEGNRILYLVQIAASLQPMEETLDRLRVRLLWLIPGTLLVTIAGGWLLATAALRPVARIIDQAERIGAESLDKRIEVPSTGDELERLSETFNAMLARLERTFRRMRQFSAAASHELRTPLTVMRGELELALRRTRDVEEYQRVIETNLEMVKEMSGIVEQLLMLSRTEEGTETLEWQLTDLGTLLEEVRHSFSSIAESKGISLEVYNMKGPVAVRGEKRLLEILFSNLIQNALKHTPFGGSVILEIGEDEGQCCVAVRDTGEGISEKEIPGIFNKFFREKTALQSSASIGLGLGLCRWIAEVHQGKIEVASSPGMGATFRVILPLPG